MQPNTHKRSDWQTDKPGKPTNRMGQQTDMQTGGQADKQANKQTNRQTTD